MNPDLEAGLRRHLATDVDHCSIRYTEERYEHLTVRQGVIEPIATGHDAGVMVTVSHQGGIGYAATSDLSDDGLSGALAQARRWAEITSSMMVLDQPTWKTGSGDYAGPDEVPWADTPTGEVLEVLAAAEHALRVDDRIVDSWSSLTRIDSESLRLSSDGGRIYQHTGRAIPDLSAIANEGFNTQRRSYGAGAHAGQGGAEVLLRLDLAGAAPRLAEEALELLGAPNTPTETMAIVLAPDQMILQIHESIGHPLELDRILGDERNYAGTSFVTADMFGTYRYGSDLLNVTFDPTVAGQLASYAFDDDGTPASREYLIRDGILERPLGGAVSQGRAGLPGVAASRATSWNRPPIDRMANLNVEPGTSSFEELIASVERGILCQTNNSWSIDDSRNKFQFGCERGTLIEDGELTTVVRNPGYRGVSATFWRNLVGVGNLDTFEVLGVANCGKGEPNQIMWVGHASPTCVFDDVEVFGGAM